MIPKGRSRPKRCSSTRGRIVPKGRFLEGLGTEAGLEEAGAGGASGLGGGEVRARGEARGEGGMRGGRGEVRGGRWERGEARTVDDWA